MSNTTISGISANCGAAFDAVIRVCSFSRIMKWNYRGVTHSCWAFYWNPDPGACLEYEGNTVEMPPDRVFLIPPYTNYSSGSTKPFRHLYLHFELPSPFDRVKRGILSFPADHARQFFQQIDQNLPVHTYPLLLRLLLYPYLYRIPAEQFLNPGESTLDPRIRRATELMNSHLVRPLPNRELCRKAGIPLNLFYREFQRELGMSPKKYLLNQRMEHARRLLIHSTDSIEEIAAQTGYADRFHFSKVFRRFYDIPPAAYRENSSGDGKKRGKKNC